jgi:hypothetical protein
MDEDMEALKVIAITQEEMNQDDIINLLGYLDAAAKSGDAARLCLEKELGERRYRRFPDWF